MSAQANRDALHLLTARDLAELWQVDDSTIYRLIQSGALASVRMGKNVRVTVEAAQEYIRTHTTPTPDVVLVDGWNNFPALRDDVMLQG